MQEEKQRTFPERMPSQVPGQLTGCIIEAVRSKENTSFLLVENASFLLVDRGAQRYKVDAKLKHEDNLNIKRLRIDIKDLDLNKVDDIKEESRLVACGKHLCGAATDFSLRCLKQCQKGTIDCIVIALCCHHRCTWKAYTGKDFLQKIGFTSKDFPILLSLTSWAVSRSKHLSGDEESTNTVVKTLGEEESPNSLVKTLGEEESPNSLMKTLGEEETPNSLVKTLGEEETPNSLVKTLGEEESLNSLVKTLGKEESPNSLMKTLGEEETNNENRYSRLGLSVEFREDVGRKIKQILDKGRVEYIKSFLNLDASLIQYVDQSSTLENIALAAFKK